MKSKAKLMARLRASRQRDGWVRIEVWVPVDLVNNVRNYVRRITKVTTRTVIVGSGKGPVEMVVTDYAGQSN